MKKVVIFAPQFPPCNLSAVHRSRYFAMHLGKFGWKAKVISVEPSSYREKLDYELEKLLPNDLELIRTKTVSVWPLRAIGDVSIRALWHHYKAFCRLASREKIDLAYIPIPPNHSAILGPLIYRRFGIRYAIDYIDPWVHPWPGCGILFSKAWFSYHLGRIIEPIVLRHASFITSVAPGYYRGALERYRWLDPSRCAALPYGAEEEDFRYLDEHPHSTYLFNPSDGNFHIVYAGAMLPKAYSALLALFKAMAILKKQHPSIGQKLRFHFIGTGSNHRKAGGCMIKPEARRRSVSDIVFEHPARIPYLDTLNHLKSAHAVLILGSSESHYTPSKVFQAILSRRAVIALLHSQSTAVGILREINAGAATVTFNDKEPPASRVDDIVKAICQTVTGAYSPDKIDWRAFRAYSAEAMTGKLAKIFDHITGNKQNAGTR